MHTRRVRKGPLREMVMANVIDKDTVAAVHYTGTFPDGEVFDSSEGKDPLVFLVGHRQMILGFEEEMMGAAVGEKREFTSPQTVHTESAMMVQFSKFHATNSLRICLLKLEQ